MPSCPKCGKPVYHAERIVALGNEYHPSCLRCEECDTKLTQGHHSAHKSKLYCNRCYQTLFGPDGFRFGVIEPKRTSVLVETPPSVVEKVPLLTVAERIELQTKIRKYNMYKESKKDQLVYGTIDGRVVYEGVIKIHWGVKHPVILPPGAMYAKQRFNRDSLYDIFGAEEAAYIQMLEDASSERRRQLLEHEGKRLLQVSRNSVMITEDDWRQAELQNLSYSGNFDPTQSMPGHGRPQLASSLSLIEEDREPNQVDGGYMSRSLERGTRMSRTGSQVRKRSASFRKVTRVKKKEETKGPEHHNFTPPYGSSTNLRVASTMNTKEVVALLFSKFKAENEPSTYTLYVVRDSGAQEPCKDEEFPLALRLKLGPSEDIARIFIMEKSDTNEIHVTEEVAEWIKFALPELEKFSKKFEEEEKREEEKLKRRFEPWRQAVRDRISEVQGIAYQQTDV